jgi:hypothetical protein
MILCISFVEMCKVLEKKKKQTWIQIQHTADDTVKSGCTDFRSGRNFILSRARACVREWVRGTYLNKNWIIAYWLCVPELVEGHSFALVVSGVAVFHYVDWSSE